MSAPELFRPGDRLIIPFLLVVGETIVNLSDGTLSGELVKYERTTVADLTVGAGIVIEQVAPPPAPEPASQVGHGLIIVESAQSALLPLGLLSRISLSFVNSAGVRMSAACIPLKGVACL